LQLNKIEINILKIKPEVMRGTYDAYIPSDSSV